MSAPRPGSITAMTFLKMEPNYKPIPACSTVKRTDYSRPARDIINGVQRMGGTFGNKSKILMGWGWEFIAGLGTNRFAEETPPRTFYFESVDPPEMLLKRTYGAVNCYIV